MIHVLLTPQDNLESGITYERTPSINKNALLLETVQLKCLKQIIGVSQSTPTLAVLGAHCICDKR